MSEIKVVHILPQKNTEANLPTGKPAELVYAIDSEKLFYGGKTENIELTKKKDMNAADNALGQRIDNTQTDINNINNTLEDHELHIEVIEENIEIIDQDIDNIEQDVVNINNALQNHLNEPDDLRYETDSTKLFYVGDEQNFELAKKTDVDAVNNALQDHIINGNHGGGGGNSGGGSTGGGGGGGYYPPVEPTPPPNPSKDYFETFSFGDTSVLDFVSDETEQVKAFIRGEIEHVIPSATFATEKLLYGVFAQLKTQYSNYHLIYINTYYNPAYGISTHAAEWSEDEREYASEYEIPYDFEQDSYTFVMTSIPPADITPENINTVTIKAFGVKAIMKEKTFFEYGSVPLAEEMTFYFENGPYAEVPSVTTALMGVYNPYSSEEKVEFALNYTAEPTQSGLLRSSTTSKSSKSSSSVMSSRSTGISTFNTTYIEDEEYHITLRAIPIEEDRKYIGVIVYAYWERYGPMTFSTRDYSEYAEIEMKVAVHAICKNKRTPRTFD